MKRAWKTRLVGLLVLLAATTTGVVAYGWEKDADFRASVHDHVFSRVVARGDGSCSVHFKLSFQAPSSAYSAPEPGRNYYRFRAKVDLSERHTVLSPQFANNKPGRRMYQWYHDTSSDGCWGKELHKVFNVDVEGCRNRNCRVRPFE